MKKTSIVAHRGGGALKTENSLSAFAHAVRLGVDEVECDVHMMADGKIVVFHDVDLRQLTGKSGQIDAIDDEERQNLCLYGANEPPPLLEELAALLAPVSVRLHIEIKAEEGQDEQARATAQAALAILHRHNLLDKTSAISFAPSCLEPFIEAGVPSGPCIDAPDEIAAADWLEQIRQWRAAGYRDLSLNGHHSSPEFVQAMRDAGFVVGVWTINGPARLSHWLKQGVDYITTDQPDLALALRDNSRQDPNHFGI